MLILKWGKRGRGGRKRRLLFKSRDPLTRSNETHHVTGASFPN